MAKLSKSLHTKQLDLSIDAVLHALDDAITPAAYWALELLDSKDDLQQATGEIVSADKIHTFQESVGTPFVGRQGKHFKPVCTCQHWPYLILVMFSVPMLPNFSLMESN